MTKRRDLLLFLLMLWLLLIGGSYALYLLILPVRIAHHALITILLARWIIRRGIPSTPLLAPLGGVLLAALISATTAADVRMALENAWFTFNHVLIFLLLIDLLRAGDERPLFRGVFGAGAIVAVIGMLEYGAGHSRPASLLLIINLAGSFAGVIAVLAFGFSWSGVRMFITRRRRFMVPITRLRLVSPGLLALALLLLAFVVINGSRGGLLALAVGIAAYFVLQKAVTRWLVLIAAPLLIVFAVLTVGRMSGDLHRLDIWRSATLMFNEHPLTGIGVGLFGQNHRVYRIMPGDYVAGAHNIPLNIASEQGAFGLMAVSVLIVAFAAAVPEQRTDRQNAAFAALIGAAANGMFDTQLATAYAVPVMLCAAYVIYPTVTEITPLVLRRWRTGMLILVIGGGLLLALSDTAQIFYERGLRDNDAESVKLARIIDPQMVLYELAWEGLITPVSIDLYLGWEGIANPTDYALTNYARYWK
jgi:O-antigen ligase